MNSFGNIYRLTSFGESHGRAIGGVIDGLPSGMVFDLRELQAGLDRRRPGQSALVSARNEKDRLIILSGIMGWNPESGAVPLEAGMEQGISLGTPIGFMVENHDARSCALRMPIIHGICVTVSVTGVEADERRDARPSAALWPVLLHRRCLQGKGFPSIQGYIRWEH